MARKVVTDVLRSRNWRTEASMATGLVALVAGWLGIEPALMGKVVDIVTLLVPIFLGQRISATATKRK